MEIEVDYGAEGCWRQLGIITQETHTRDAARLTTFPTIYYDWCYTTQKCNGRNESCTAVMFVVPFQLIVVFVHFRFVQLFKKTTTKTAPEHNNRHKKNDRPPPDLN